MILLVIETMIISIIYFNSEWIRYLIGILTKMHPSTVILLAITVIAVLIGSLESYKSISQSVTDTSVTRVEVEELIKLVNYIHSNSNSSHYEVTRKLKSVYNGIDLGLVLMVIIIIILILGFIFSCICVKNHVKDPIIDELADMKKLDTVQTKLTDISERLLTIGNNQVKIAQIAKDLQEGKPLTQ